MFLPSPCLYMGLTFLLFSALSCGHSGVETRTIEIQLTAFRVQGHSHTSALREVSHAEDLMIMHRVSTDPHGSLLELHHWECLLAEITFPDHIVFFHGFHIYAEVVTVQ